MPPNFTTLDELEKKLNNDSSSSKNKKKKVTIVPDEDYESDSSVASVASVVNTRPKSILKKSSRPSSTTTNTSANTPIKEEEESLMKKIVKIIVRIFGVVFVFAILTNPTLIKQLILKNSSLTSRQLIDTSEPDLSVYDKVPNIKGWGLQISIFTIIISIIMVLITI